MDAESITRKEFNKMFQEPKKKPFTKEHPFLKEVRKVRQEAIEKIQQVKATLDGEKDWFLCVRKKRSAGITTFDSCTPKEESETNIVSSDKG